MNDQGQKYLDEITILDWIKYDWINVTAIADKKDVYLRGSRRSLEEQIELADRLGVDLKRIGLLDE